MIKKLLSVVLAAFMVFSFNAVVFAEELREYVDENIEGNMCVIKVTRAATGEVETYAFSLDNEGAVSESAENMVISPEPMILSIESDALSAESYASEEKTTYTINWGIRSNEITYQSPAIWLNIYDTIEYSFSVMYKGTTFKAGVRNSLNGAYSWDSEKIAYDNGSFTSGSFTMAVSGNFGLSIWNTGSTANNYSGTFTTP